MNIFEYAAKNKTRFTSEIGSLTVEDLYDLPLDSAKKASLNSVAKAANNQLKASEEESFVATTSTANKHAQIKLDIVKHIIAERLAAVEARKNAEAVKERKELIATVIAEKQNDNLKNMSLEELEAELAK